MKKLLSIAMALFLLLALTACAGPKDTPVDSVPKDHLARIQEKGVLVVGQEGDWPPFTYEDESGNKIGFDAEVAQGIADYLGVELEIVYIPWDNLFMALDAGQIDMIANGVDVTPERQQSYDFSDPYAYDTAVLIVLEDNDDIHTFEDLNGKTTANSNGSTYAELGEKYGATVSGVDTLAETLTLVKSGAVDATINASTSYVDYMLNVGGPFKVVDRLTGDNATPYAIPIVKGEDNATLLREINKALAEMYGNGSLKALSVKYFAGEDLTQK